MNIDERNNENKPMKQFKATLDMCMGVMYIVIAFFLLKVPAIAVRFGKGFTMALCTIIVVYGIYRIVRGVLSAKKLFR